MALKNLGQLKSSIADWLDRGDQADRIPTYIRLAEASIYRRLRSRDNEFVFRVTKASGGIVGGTQTPTPGAGFHTALPSNYKEMKHITWNGKPLQDTSWADLQARLTAHVDSQVKYYAREGLVLEFSQAIEADPQNWQDEDVLTYVYYGTESLVDLAVWQTPQNPTEIPGQDGTPSGTTERTDDATTRLFLMAPDLFLFGALHHACRMLRDSEKAAEWKAMYDEVLAELTYEDDLSDVGGDTRPVYGAYGDDI